MAQWKRAGPITQRSVDRNNALLRFGRRFWLSRAWISTDRWTVTMYHITAQPNTTQHSHSRESYPGHSTLTVKPNTAQSQHSTAQHSTAKRSTAQSQQNRTGAVGTSYSQTQHSTAQHSTAQQSTVTAGQDRCRRHIVDESPPVSSQLPALHRAKTARAPRKTRRLRQKLTDCREGGGGGRRCDLTEGSEQQGSAK